MTYLLAALAAPIAGPLLYKVLHDHPKAVTVVDKGVYFAVPALLAWQVAHIAMERRSWVVLAVVAAGFVVPSAIERLSIVLRRHTDKFALVVGISGLALHALLEGAALVPGDAEGEVAFVLAIVLHRIPVGLVVWWLVRPRYGVLKAVMSVGSIVMATVAGYLLGAEVLAGVHGAEADLYQAFVSGSLVHVVFHQGRHDHDHSDDGHGHPH